MTSRPTRPQRPGPGFSDSQPPTPQLPLPRTTPLGPFVPTCNADELLARYGLDEAFPTAWIDIPPDAAAAAVMQNVDSSSTSLVVGSSLSPARKPSGALSDASDPLGVIEGTVMRFLGPRYMKAMANATGAASPQSSAKNQKTQVSGHSRSGSVSSMVSGSSMNISAAEGEATGSGSLTSSSNTSGAKESAFSAMKIARKLRIGRKHSKKSKLSQSSDAGSPSQDGTPGSVDASKDGNGEAGDYDDAATANADNDQDWEGDDEVSPEQISIFHRDFDPKKFLALVHSGTTFREFEAGLDRLRNSKAEHKVVMQKLVKENFDDFVTAKSSVDEIYRKMRTTNLNPSTEFGTESFSATLQVAHTTAVQVFSPILARRKQADKIKSTLALLERFKFFFNLPNTLHSEMMLENLAACVRDFKKGRNLIQSMYPTALGTGGSRDGLSATSDADGAQMADAQQQQLQQQQQQQQQVLQQQQILQQQQQQQTKPFFQQQKRLFEKIWSEVTNVMAHVKERLFKQLTDHELPVDTQQQAISLVLEVDPTADPLGVYLESRCKWILAQLRNKVLSHARIFSDMNNTNVLRIHPFNAAQFKRAVQLRNRKEFDSVFAKDAEVLLWQGFTSAIRALTDCLASHLPDFWKIAKAFSDPATTNITGAPVSSRNVKKNRRGAKATHSEQCHRMLGEIIEYFISLILHIFGNLKSLKSADENTTASTDAGIPSDNVNVKTSIPGGAPPLPAFPPLTNVNSITVAQFAPRIMQSLKSGLSNIQSLKIPGTSNMLLPMIRSIRADFLDKIIFSWKSDVNAIPVFEDWKLERNTTGLQILFACYQRYMLTRVFRLWSMSELVTSDSTNRADGLEPIQFVKFIAPTTAETLNTYLTKIKNLATTIPPPSVDSSQTSEPRTVAPPHGHTNSLVTAIAHGNGERNSSLQSQDATAHSELETRMLVTCSNLKYLRCSMIPSLRDTIEALCTREISMTSEANTLYNQLSTMISDVDNEILLAYVRSRTIIIRKFLRAVNTQAFSGRPNSNSNLLDSSTGLKNDELNTSSTGGITNPFARLADASAAINDPQGGGVLTVADVEAMAYSRLSNLSEMKRTVRPWVFFVLMEIVRIQVAVLAVNQELIERVLSAIHYGLARLMHKTLCKDPSQTGNESLASSGVSKRQNKMNMAARAHADDGRGSDKSEKKSTQIQDKRFSTAVAQQLALEIVCVQRILTCFTRDVWVDSENTSSDVAVTNAPEFAEKYDAMLQFLSAGSGMSVMELVSQVEKSVSDFLENTKLQFACFRPLDSKAYEAILEEEPTPA